MFHAILCHGYTGEVEEIEHIKVLADPSLAKLARLHARNFPATLVQDAWKTHSSLGAGVFARVGWYDLTAAACGWRDIKKSRS